jgi:hypothetical protein
VSGPAAPSSKRTPEGYAVLPAVTLVALTGYSRPDDGDEKRLGSFDAFLVEPVDFPTLVHTLEEDIEEDTEADTDSGDA